jgi:hypothetical protein
MITWMRGNFILPAMQAFLALGVIVVGALLCRARTSEAVAAPPGSEAGLRPAGGPD